MKTTKLDAVNQMLKAIGTMPVNSLNVASNSDAAIAESTLESVKMEVEQRGWWFNTELGVIFAGGSNVPVPSNALAISSAKNGFNYDGEERNIIEKGGMFYDLDSKTHTFSQPIKVDVVYTYTFEQLPEAARKYIAIRAARIFQTQVLGDETLGVYTAVHEMEAFRALQGDQVTKNPSSNLYEMRARRRFEALMPEPVMPGGNNNNNNRGQ